MRHLRQVQRQDLPQPGQVQGTPGAPPPDEDLVSVLGNVPRECPSRVRPGLRFKWAVKASAKRAPGWRGTPGQDGRLQVQVALTAAW